MLRRVLSLLLGLFMIGGSQSPAVEPPEDTHLTFFFYNYGGMVFPAFSGMEALLTEDGWRATFYVGREDVEDVPLTDEDVQALESLMRDYKLWSWAGFDEIDRSILDGEHFRFSVTYADGTKITASGSNSFPDDYWTAQNAILMTIENMLAAHEIPYQSY